MAQASTRSQEYWRPANPKVARLIDPQITEPSCWNCGTEYSPEARFCHGCGSRRDPGPHTAAPQAQPMDAARTKSPRLPLTSLVCLVVGIGCVISAALMSVIYRSDTLADWQAVQVWRIEWLLAALAALLAGVLLKRVN